MGSSPPPGEGGGAAILKVDADGLHRLGGTLAEHAGAIRQITVPQWVVMPGSPVQAASDQVVTGVLKAFGLIGGHISEMAERMSKGATTYTEFDRANADQYQRYLGS